MASTALPRASISGRRIFVFSLKCFYPVTMFASCWFALHGPGDKENAKRFTYQGPTNHRALTSSEYAALPSAIQAHRTKIVEEMINVYSCKPTYDAEFSCALDCTFEDPMIYLSGHTSIACLIWGIPKITRNAEVSNVEVEHMDQAVKMKFDYVWETSFFKVESPVQLYLELDEEQKRIKSIRDMWNGREFLEAFGFIKMSKVANGYATRVLFGVPTGRLFR